jgi:hypothetical protein
VIKHNFDQTPKLLETFDQLIRSSEIRSTDPLSSTVLFKNLVRNSLKYKMVHIRKTPFLRLDTVFRVPYVL